MTKIISISNQKGGVGKTTTAVNLSASLALKGFSTLLIDIDPQANSTSALGINPSEIQGGIYRCLNENRLFEKEILETDINNLKILPANIDLVGAEIEMINLDNREFVLKKCISQIKNPYDYIIIDCAPSLGLITVNALTAANSVIIPVQCEYLALEGLAKLLNTIKIIQSNYNENLSIEGILMTMYDKRINLSKQVVDDIKKHFGNLIFETMISRNVKLSESPSFGKPCIVYDKESTGSKNYWNLAQEIVEKNLVTSSLIK